MTLSGFLYQRKLSTIAASILVLSLGLFLIYWILPLVTEQQRIQEQTTIPTNLLSEGQTMEMVQKQRRQCQHDWECPEKTRCDTLVGVCIPRI